MEDRYLFKAKTAQIVGTYNNGVEDGMWVHGSLRCDVGKYTIFQFESERADYVEYEIDPDTICQCTGLKDKNGNLIWENDLVMTVYDGIEHTYVVKWDDSELGFKATNGKKNYGNYFQYLGCCDEIEVIGNIFDNPELLETFLTIKSY
jgi:uncharacterized phage protein (TIGR01671 family)